MIKTCTHLLVVAVAAVVAACSDGGNSSKSNISATPPSEAVSAVRNYFMANYFDCKHNTGCKELTVKYAQKSDISAADRANHITEKWVIGMDYLYMHAGRWEESRVECHFAEKNAQGWQHRYYKGPVIAECLNSINF